MKELEVAYHQDRNLLQSVESDEMINLNTVKITINSNKKSSSAQNANLELAHHAGHG